MDTQEELKLRCDMIEADVRRIRELLATPSLPPPTAFRVGDLVRMVDKNHEAVPLGMVGVVRRIDPETDNNLGVEWSGRPNGGHNLHGLLSWPRSERGFYVANLDIESA